MRFTLLIFATLPLLLHAVDGDTLNRVDSLGKRQGYWKITAAMKKDNSFADQPAIAEEGRYVNGMKTGMWILYYPNGNVRLRLPYVNNRPYGYTISYYESGHVKECGTWQGTRWVGEYKIFYETDTLRMHLWYNNIGQRHGSSRYYHQNGKLMVEAYHKNGREDSICREFYDDGSLRKECYYSNATIDPSRTKTHDPPPGAHWPGDEQKREGIQYYPVDPVHKEIRFIVPDPNRKDYIYDEQGKLIRIKVYKDGQYVGDEPLPE